MNYKLLPIVPAALSISMLLCACTLPGADLSAFPTKTGNNVQTTEMLLSHAQSPFSGENALYETELTIPESGSVRVSFSEYKELFGAPDDQERVFFEFSYAEPKIIVFGNDTAAAEINERIAIANELFYSGYGEMPGVASAFEYAIDAYSYFSQTGTQTAESFYMSRTAKVLRADSSIISILFTDSAYFGFDEAVKNYSGMCFSAADGSTVRYYGLGPDAEALNSNVVQSLISDYKIQVNGYETAQYFAGLSYDGLVFNIDGMLYTVNYGKLKNVVFDKYLPEDYRGDSAIELKQFDPSVQYTKSISDIIVADEEGQNYLLDITGDAEHLRLSKVVYVNDSFCDNGDIWFADCISDTMLQVKLIIPEGLPNLMLSYENAEGAVIKQLISQNGFDGSAILVADGVKAVG